MQHQITIQDLLSGKTFREPSAATEEKTSAPSSGRCVKSKTPALMVLNLRGGDGSTQGASWETVTALPGVSMTLNIGESPSGARESTLSQILEANVLEKYCLSPRACQGILNRAERRGKILPEMLRKALEEVIALKGISSTEEAARTDGAGQKAHAWIGGKT
jgi:hypothetical protein